VLKHAVQSRNHANPPSGSFEEDRPVPTQDQLADFIRSRISVGRVQPGADYSYSAWYPVPYHGASVPTLELVAAELVRNAEFRALKLGTFLNTPTGDFVEEAVALAVPRAFAPEFALLVDALKLAAELQQGEARGNVILTAIGAVVIGVVVNEARKAA
jgi:hypothetical protein